MSSLERLVYCSRARFPAATERGLHPEVGRILMQSRRNNPRDGLVGGLYFANGWFFQCLEGPGGAIDALLDRLHADPRHGEVSILLREPIAARRFTRWSMKYVPDAAEVLALLRSRSLASFEPARFDRATTNAMVTLLIAGSEASAGTALADAPAKPRSNVARLGAAAAVLGGIAGAAWAVFAR